MSDARVFRRPVEAVVPQALILLLVLLSIPGAASAQTPDAKHWGIGASFVPVWTANESLQENFMGLDWTPPVEGSEWSIGFVRGTTLGGDWGVSYIRKPFKDAETTVSETFEDCFGSDCISSTSTVTTALEGVLVHGVEYHIFIPFTTYAERVQVGLNIGAGAAFPEGTVRQSGTFTTTFTAPGQPPQTFTEEFSDQYPVADAELLYPVVALLKVELQGSLIVAPGFKVKISAGMNTPSAFSFRIGAVFLIGAN